MSTGAEVTKKGISRRDLIKKGAVAGAVFWSVPVIESVTSRAAAQSGCVSFNASWIYVIYTISGQDGYFYTGFTPADSNGGSCTAASYPKNSGPGANTDVSTPGCTVGTSTVYFTLAPSTGTPPDIYSGASSGAKTTLASYKGSPSCTTYLTQKNGEVTPATTSVTIVAAFCFGKSYAVGSCISSNSNSTCANCDATN